MTRKQILARLAELGYEGPTSYKVPRLAAILEAVEAGTEVPTKKAQPKPKPKQETKDMNTTYQDRLEVITNEDMGMTDTYLLSPSGKFRDAHLGYWLEAGHGYSFHSEAPFEVEHLDRAEWTSAVHSEAARLIATGETR